MQAGMWRQRHWGLAEDACLEGQVSEEEGVEGHPQSPHVGRLAVVGAAQPHLGGCSRGGAKHVQHGSASGRPRGAAEARVAATLLAASHGAPRAQLASCRLRN